MVCSFFIVLSCNFFDQGKKVPVIWFVHFFIVLSCNFLFLWYIIMYKMEKVNAIF